MLFPHPGSDSKVCVVSSNLEFSERKKKSAGNSSLRTKIEKKRPKIFRLAALAGTDRSQPGSFEKGGVKKHRGLAQTSVVSRKIQQALKFARR